MVNIKVKVKYIKDSIKYHKPIISSSIFNNIDQISYKFFE